LVIAGFLGTWIGWRYSFGVLGVLAAGIFLFGKQLTRSKARAT
jgi:predicted MFS family arabinose efflux permease